MSDYTMDDLGKYLSPEVEDLQDGAEHDHEVVRELEAEVNRLKGLLKQARKTGEANASACALLGKQNAKLEDENAKLRERNQQLVERLEDERNAR